MGRFSEEGRTVFYFAKASENDGPFVYRLGLQVFILARGVRLPYGLQQKTAMPPARVAFFIPAFRAKSYAFVCGAGRNKKPARSARAVFLL